MVLPNELAQNNKYSPINDLFSSPLDGKNAFIGSDSLVLFYRLVLLPLLP